MGLLDQFKAYVAANTPRSTRAPVSPAKVIYDGLLRQPVENVKANAAQFGSELQQAPQDLRGLLSPEFGAQVRQQMNQPASIDKSKAMEMAMDYLQTTNPVAGMVGAIKAYHGSPHKFDKFDMSKLGTGEGAQAYGHGLYFAESPAVAQKYSEILNMPKVTEINEELRRLSGVMDSDAKFQGAYRQFKSDVGEKAAKEYDRLMKSKLTTDPQMYETSLRWPDPAREASDPLGPQHFLDWDKPLSEQPDMVQSALTNATAAKRPLLARYFKESKGLSDSAQRDLRKNLGLNVFDIQDSAGSIMEASLGKGAAASNYLKQQGIPGIRYLDGNSRGAGEGSSNYVVFDDAIPEIVARNGEPAGLLDMGKKKAKK